MYAYLVSVRAALLFLVPSGGGFGGEEVHIHLVILRRAKGLQALQLSALEMSKIRFFSNHVGTFTTSAQCGERTYSLF